MSNPDDNDFGPSPTFDTADSVTETTNRSWLQRLGSSLMGILIGMALLAGSVWGIFWNEGRSVDTARSLSEGRGLAVSIEAGRVDAANEGRLVHLTGAAATGAPLSDPLFQVKAQGLKLVRHAEMYQWQQEEKTETRTKLGGGEEKVTTYSYSRVWKSGRIDSSRFRQQNGHENPQGLPELASFVASDAKLGAFALPPALLQRLGGGEDMPVTSANFTAPMGQSPPVRALNGAIYSGQDPARPQVGDLRISYKLVPNGPVSAIAKQTGASLAAYQTKAGDALYMLRSGEMSREQMFKVAESENATLTWILRGVALLVLWLGFALVFAPLSVLVSVIPFLEDVVSAGAGLLALVLALIVGAVTIAIAWFAVRPLMSVGIVVAGLALAYGAAQLRRRPQSAPMGAPARPSA